MARPFEDLYTEEDADGNVPDWEWDPEEMVFRSADGRFLLKPTAGVIEREDDVETEDDGDDS